MEFIIADTFTDSLARLTGEEQKLVKTTAFDLQMNPASPGMSFHKLDNAKDKNFWSVRVGSDIRLIVHRTDSSLLLCYADHHDKAYAWAERRKLETHPKTGAAQLVEIRETVKEILIPVYVQTELPMAPKPPPPPMFADISNDQLLGYGVPAEWIDDVKSVTTEDSLLTVVEHLPAEAAEALLQLATGGQPRIIPPAVPAANPFEHPDALRRFRVMTNVEELQRALEFPWDKWTVFLHPEQREWVEKDYNGPARVSGSAGTGKTIVALHRAVHLARSHADARVLLTTFSDTLASALQTKLKRLLGNEPHLAERIDVCSIEAIGLRLYKANVGKAEIVARDALADLVRQASESVASHNFSLHFLLTEWEQVVDAWQLGTWDEYRDVVRLGRKTKLPESQRKVLWTIFERVREGLHSNKWLTYSELFSQLANVISKSGKVWFDSRSWTKPRTSAWPISDSWPHWAANVPMRSFSQGIWASESSSSPFHGRPWGRGPWTLPDVARELSHLPPNPHSGGPIAGSKDDRHRRGNRESQRNGFRVQRSAPGHLLVQERKGGDCSCWQVDG
jgi:mRNA-degrading endonuclease RelE of RelBE toxin-antitoxin system